MTRKQKEKMVLDTLGLKVGDVVELTYFDAPNEPYIYKIIEEDERYALEAEVNDLRSIGILLYYDFTKLIPKKKKGQLLCGEIHCQNCPLFLLKCHNDGSDVLYDILESTNKYYKLDTRIYEAYKSILNDEVEE